MPKESLFGTGEKAQDYSGENTDVQSATEPHPCGSEQLTVTVYLKNGTRWLEKWVDLKGTTRNFHLRGKTVF